MQKRIVKLEVGQQQLRNQVYQVLNKERHGRIVYPEPLPISHAPAMQRPVTEEGDLNQTQSSAERMERQAWTADRAQMSSVGLTSIEECHQQLEPISGTQDRPMPFMANSGVTDQFQAPDEVTPLIEKITLRNALPHEFCQNFLEMMTNLPRRRLSPEIVSPHFNNDELSYLLDHFGGGNSIGNPADIAIIAEEIYRHNSWESVIEAPTHRAMIRDGLGPFLQTAWELVEKKRGLVAQSDSSVGDEEPEVKNASNESDTMRQSRLDLSPEEITRTPPEPLGKEPPVEITVPLRTEANVAEVPFTPPFSPETTSAPIQSISQSEPTAQPQRMVVKPVLKVQPAKQKRRTAA